MEKYIIYKTKLINLLKSFIPELYQKMEDRDSIICLPCQNSIIRLNLDTLILEVEGPLSMVAMAMAKRLGISFGHWSEHTLLTYVRATKGFNVKANDKANNKDNDKDNEKELQEFQREGNGIINVYFLIIAYTYYFSDLDVSYFFNDRSTYIFLEKEDYFSELNVIKNSSTALLILKAHNGNCYIKEVTLMSKTEDNLTDPKKAKKELEHLSESVVAKKDAMPVYGDAAEAIFNEDAGEKDAGGDV